MSSLKSPSVGDYELHDLNLSPLGSRFVRDRPGRARKRKGDGSALGDVEDSSEIVEKLTRNQDSYFSGVVALPSHYNDDLIT